MISQAYTGEKHFKIISCMYLSIDCGARCVRGHGMVGHVTPWMVFGSWLGVPDIATVSWRIIEST